MANFNGQDKEDALSKYDMHDAGEAVVEQILNKQHINYVHSGFDGRTDTEREDFHNLPTSEYSGDPDLLIFEEEQEVYNEETEEMETKTERVYIDIKTTSYRRFFGNMERNAWTKYNELPGKVIIACFALDTDNGNEILEAGCYRVDEMVTVGGNNTPYKQFVHCDEELIEPLDEILELIKRTVREVQED